MKNKQHIRGITAFEILGDLDPAMVADAEIPGAIPPPMPAPATRSVGRVLRSGWMVAVVCLLVSFGVVAAIVYAGRQAPDHQNSPPAGVVTDAPEGSSPESTNASVLCEGKIPFGDREANYTIRTEQVVYDTTVKRLLITAKGKNKGEAIIGFQSWAVECLTDPDWTANFSYTEEALEPSTPDPDQYATWQKTIFKANGSWKPGIYRVHHMVWDGAKQAYISEAHCEFAIGEEWGDILEDAWNGVPLPEDSDTDTVTSAESLPTRPNYSEMPPLDSDLTLSPEPPFTISVRLASGDIYGTLTVTYTAVEQGESLIDPPVGIALYRVFEDGEMEGLPGVELISTTEHIASVHPLKESHNYAVFSKAHMVSGQEHLPQGTYRVLSLDSEGRVIAYDDLILPQDIYVAE